MTVSATAITAVHLCNGALDEFDFTFGVAESSEIKVILTSAAGAETVLVETTNYVVTGTPIAWDGDGNPTSWDFSSGGTVTTNVVYDAGNTITITINVPMTQEQVFTGSMANLASRVEAGLDKLTRICKQLERRLAVAEVEIETGLPTPEGSEWDLGQLASDPDYSGWGATQAGLRWFNTTDAVFKYWNGSDVRVL